MAEKATNTQYRIQNWSEYNAALKNRGRLTFWVDEDGVDDSRSIPQNKVGGLLVSLV